MEELGGGGGALPGPGRMERRVGGMLLPGGGAKKGLRCDQNRIGVRGLPRVGRVPQVRSSKPTAPERPKVNRDSRISCRLAASAFGREPSVSVATSRPETLGSGLLFCRGWDNRPPPTAPSSPVDAQVSCQAAARTASPTEHQSNSLVSNATPRTVFERSGSAPKDTWQPRSPGAPVSPLPPWPPRSSWWELGTHRSHRGVDTLGAPPTPTFGEDSAIVPDPMRTAEAWRTSAGRSGREAKGPGRRR
jgi:hypothetical protein